MSLDIGFPSRLRAAAYHEALNISIFILMHIRNTPACVAVHATIDKLNLFSDSIPGQLTCEYYRGEIVKRNSTRG